VQCSAGGGGVVVRVIVSRQACLFINSTRNVGLDRQGRW
jgi:hypothetical protein